MTTDLKPYGYPTGVPIGSQVTVTIGRNTTDGNTLWRFEWEQFILDAKAALADQVEPTAVFGPFKGEGVWEGEREESAVWILIAGRHASISHIDEALGKVADIYGQDAIAWSFGPNFLAIPARNKPVSLPARL